MQAGVDSDEAIRAGERLAEKLRGAVSQYLFVSTISVYAPKTPAGSDETAAVRKLADPKVETITAETYGGLKALCEDVGREGAGAHATIVRPSLIVGPGDTTDRYTYWVARLDRGGDVLAPGAPSDAVQFIDVRDLGIWMVQLVEHATAGTFHAAGPRDPFSIGDLLASCRAAAGRPAHLVWVPPSFLEQHKVAPWGDMPCWVPANDEDAGIGHLSCKRAIAAGLKFRAPVETARDTLSWWRGLPVERRAKLRAGLAASREAEVLAAWKARPAASSAAPPSASPR